MLEYDPGNDPGNEPGASPQARRRIAIVEGDPAVRDSLATLLALEDRTVLSYATAAALLRDLDDEPVACVIADADLPDGSGLELYTLLQARHPHTRFALLISRKDAPLLAHARALGIRHVFPKPLVHRSLLSFVAAE